MLKFEPRPGCKGGFTWRCEYRCLRSAGPICLRRFVAEYLSIDSKRFFISTFHQRRVIVCSIRIMVNHFYQTWRGNRLSTPSCPKCAGAKRLDFNLDLCERRKNLKVLKMSCITHYSSHSPTRQEWHVNPSYWDLVSLDGFIRSEKVFKKMFRAPPMSRSIVWPQPLHAFGFDDDFLFMKPQAVHVRDV